MRKERRSDMLDVCVEQQINDVKVKFYLCASHTLIRRLTATKVKLAACVSMVSSTIKLLQATFFPLELIALQTVL